MDRQTSGLIGSVGLLNPRSKSSNDIIVDQYNDRPTRHQSMFIRLTIDQMNNSKIKSARKDMVVITE